MVTSIIKNRCIILLVNFFGRRLNEKKHPLIEQINQIMFFLNEIGCTNHFNLEIYDDLILI
jgi:hypothetical protein